MSHLFARKRNCRVGLPLEGVVDEKFVPSLERCSSGLRKGVAGTVSLLRFLPFFSVSISVLFVFFLFGFRFLPFHSKKKGETPSARPLLRSPEFKKFVQKKGLCSFFGPYHPQDKVRRKDFIKDPRLCH